MLCVLIRSGEGGGGGGGGRYSNEYTQYGGGGILMSTHNQEIHGKVCECTLNQFTLCNNFLHL